MDIKMQKMRSLRIGARVRANLENLSLFNDKKFESRMRADFIEQGLEDNQIYTIKRKVYDGPGKKGAVLFGLEVASSAIPGYPKIIDYFPSYLFERAK